MKILGLNQDMVNAIQNNMGAPILMTVNGIEFRFKVDELKWNAGDEGHNFGGEVTMTPYKLPLRIPGKRIYIHGDTQEQVRRWANENDIRSWSWVFTAEHIKGIENATVVIIGSGRMLSAFREELRVRQGMRRVEVIRVPS